MSDYLRTVLVNEQEYTLQLCSAQQQWDMLNLFFKYGLSNALYSIANGDNELVCAALFGSFAERATDQERSQVTEMLLGFCMKKGSDKPITIDDFHSRMFDFITLHIEALKANYADFMPFLQSPAQDETQETTNGEMSPV